MGYPQYEKAPREAGLEMFSGVLDALNDRETIDPAVLAALTPAQVTEFYDAYIAPAIDRIEGDILDLVEAGRENADLTEDQVRILEDFSDSLTCEVTVEVEEAWATRSVASPPELLEDIMLSLDGLYGPVNGRELAALRARCSQAGWTLLEVEDHDPTIDWAHGAIDPAVARHMLTTPGTYHTLRLGRVTADGQHHRETDYAFAYRA